MAHLKTSWLALCVCLAVLAWPPVFAQQGDNEGEEAEVAEAESSDDEEGENDVRVEENVFIPSEEISQDNAVPFPVDI